MKNLHIAYRPEVDTEDMATEVNCKTYIITDGVVGIEWENQYLIIPLDLIKYIRASEIKEHKKPTGND